KFKWETEFKQTEIGEVPREWEVWKLKDLFKIESGRRPAEVNDNGKFEVWGAKGFMGYISSYNHCGEFLITGRVGTLGHVFYIPKNIKIWASDNALIITKNKDEAIAKFYFYHLKTRKEEIEELNVGSTQPLITQRDLKEIKVPYPSPEEQSRIATVLSWFDDLIENKKRQNEILEKVAMAIFKSWFVDFEPFKDEEFVYSEELGKEIPKGWEVKAIGEVVDILYGKGLPESKRKNGSFPVVGSSGIVGYHAQFLATPPSIVIGRKGNAGSVYLMLEPFYPIDTVFYTGKTTPAITFYIYHHLKLTPLAEIGMTDTAVPGININNLKAVKIPIPPQPILQHFHFLVEPLFQKIIFNQRQIMVLRKIRDALLPKLVFGKLRVEVI
ncbi:MAG: restriction endonuclease subunit S, partial [Candidatus Desulfofervidus sp.]|nr:restriction endonuclease subunit S [Candidatus Desulfofervidus sp.]